MNYLTRKINALSVKQPWANLIASGRKTIETRSWETNFRGEILIVSSKSPAISPAGYALAVVELVDCRPMVKTDEVAACCGVYSNAYSWVLKNLRTIEPFPVKGQLGIYRVSIPLETLEEGKLDRSGSCNLTSLWGQISNKINFARS